jgi:hypothetical protein
LQLLLALPQIPLEGVLIFLACGVLPEPGDVLERLARLKDAARGRRPFQRLHAFRHAELVAGVSLELLHAERRVLGGRAVVGQSVDASLPERLLKTDLALQRPLLRGLMVAW